MLVSTKGRYALRVMTELASHKEGEIVPLLTIAEKQNISEKYLEGILVILTKAGVIEGLRGKGGGYRLNRPPKDYSVGEILRLTEGSLSPVACLGCKPNTCKNAENCKTLPMWTRLDEIIGSYLDSISIEDLMNNNV